MSNDPIISALTYRFPGKGEVARELGIVPRYWEQIRDGEKPFHPRLRTIARYLLIFGPLPPDPLQDTALAHPYAVPGKPKQVRTRRRKAA